MEINFFAEVVRSGMERKLQLCRENTPHIANSWNLIARKATAICNAKLLLPASE
jgi:hypothetical protein